MTGTEPDTRRNNVATLEDHKTKKPKVKDVEGGKLVTFPEIVTKGPDGKAVLKDGKPMPLSVTVTVDALDDFELFDDIRAIELDNNAARLPSLLRRLVGEQFDSVMQALRNERGRVRIEPAQQWLLGLMESLKA